MYRPNLRLGLSSGISDIPVYELLREAQHRDQRIMLGGHIPWPRKLLWVWAGTLAVWLWMIWYNN